MKVAAILVLVLCLAAVVGIGYLYLNTNVTVSVDRCIATDAMNQADYFALLKTELEQDSFVGVRFTRDLPTAPEDCVFYTYTVQVKNNAFLPVEVIELQVTPMTGDFLQIGDPELHSLASGGTAEIAATILTSREMHNVRELTVTYYIWGIPFTARLTSQ